MDDTYANSGVIRKGGHGAVAYISVSVRYEDKEQDGDWVSCHDLMLKFHRHQNIIKTISMPLNLFSRSFSPGKSPPRRSASLSSLRRETDNTGQDLSQDFSKIKLNIGGQNATFEDGEWITGGSRGRTSNREVARLHQQNQTLLEENNLLKLKVELLLDMLTEKSADTLMKDREIARLKSRSGNGQ
ncbi:protein chibby homolog 1 [Cherax quadricarinatus]